jgi:glyoxylase-like metal-dependent hydrolase (beta-lactamase superfamily II)
MTEAATLFTTKATKIAKITKKNTRNSSVPSFVVFPFFVAFVVYTSAMPASAADRRHFLQLLAGAAALPLGRRVASQTVPVASGRLSVTPVGPLRVVSGADANFVVLNGPSGMLFVNGFLPPPDVSVGFASPGSTNTLEFLFNTDWHPHNTAFNSVVAQGGGQILAHEFTKQYLSIERHVEWQNKTHKPLPAKALPTTTFTKAGSMTFGGQTIEYAPLGQAHTDGDIYLFFREANVLVVGDVMTVGKYPIADYTSGGWLGGLQSATKTLLSLANPETRIVPGDGPVQTRADLQAQYDMLSASRDAFVKMMRQGRSADEMLAAGATKAFDAKWGDPQLFVRTSYRGLWLHVRELGGIV